MSEQLAAMLVRVRQRKGYTQCGWLRGWARPVGGGSPRTLEPVARQSFETLRPLWERTERKDEE